MVSPVVASLVALRARDRGPSYGLALAAMARNHNKFWPGVQRFPSTPELPSGGLPAFP